MNLFHPLLFLKFLQIQFLVFGDCVLGLLLSFTAGANESDWAELLDREETSPHSEPVLCSQNANSKYPFHKVE